MSDLPSVLGPGGSLRDRLGTCAFRDPHGPGACQRGFAHETQTPHVIRYTVEREYEDDGTLIGEVWTR